MECVEIVRHFVNTKRYVNNPGGVERFRGRMGGEKERKGVSDDQKLSTNGGFWTLPLYGHHLFLSPLFCPLIQTIAILMVCFILYLSNCQTAKTNTSAG